MNADAIQKTIDRLTVDYNGYMSSYNSYIKTSSFYSDQVANDRFRLSTVSSLYTSTQKGIDIMTKQYSELMLNKISYNTTLYAQSSILNSALINLATYDAQIKNNVNTIELTSYQYRETYGRVKRINVQSNYESLVLQAIQNASTLTSKLGSPQAADLTTLNIPVVYSKLTTVNSFLDSFSNIYSAYNKQGDNIAALSTSIGYQKNSWSTLQNYTDKLYREIPDTSAQNITSYNVYQNADYPEITGYSSYYFPSNGGVMTIEAAQNIANTLPYCYGFTYTTTGNAYFKVYVPGRMAGNNTGGVGNRFFEKPPYLRMLPQIISGNIDFSLKKDIVSQQLKTYSTQQMFITGIKQNFSTVYSTLFTYSEFITQESTISSFMINGYKQGIANLAANGVIFSV